jgi:BASS family bile acid:Na+ symporter
LSKPIANSGPVFAAIAIGFNNDPEILGILTALVFVSLILSAVIASWFGKGDGEEEGAPGEAPAA